ncbi:MAG: TraR/DksA family transcriptional regulator [Roseovarius sp.]
MDKLEHYKSTILARLEELGDRTQQIETELSVPKPSSFGDQAIDIEDDEVLEGLGFAADLEIAALEDALERIEAKTYGICLECEAPISDARLTAVPAALLCKSCAGAGPH